MLPSPIKSVPSFPKTAPKFVRRNIKKPVVKTTKRGGGGKF